MKTDETRRFRSGGAQDRKAIRVACASRVYTSLCLPCPTVLLVILVILNQALDKAYGITVEDRSSIKLKIRLETSSGP